MLTENYTTELIRINRSLIDKKIELNDWFMERAKIVDEMLTGARNTSEGNELLILGDACASVVKDDIKKLEIEFHFFNTKLNIIKKAENV